MATPAVRHKATPSRRLGVFPRRNRASNLAAQGVVFEKPPADNPRYGIYHCFLRDPNGYLIVSTQPTLPQVTGRVRFQPRRAVGSTVSRWEHA